MASAAGTESPRPADTAPARPDVFVSYSRRHKRFVEGTLVPALAAHGKEVWIDLEDSPPAADWRAQVLAGVAAANAVVLVISPDSLASPVCGEELARAVELNNKRLIPVVRRDPELSVLLATEGARTEPTAEAEDALRRSLAESPARTDPERSRERRVER
jgi:TIR domain